MTTLATVSMNASLNDRRTNLLKYEKFICEAARSEVDLIVFPECSYQGYHLWNLQYDQGKQRLNAERMEYFYETSETIPGPATERLSQLAKEHNMHIVFGMVERSRYGGSAIIFNSSALIGPDGLIGVYRKVHQPHDEMHVFASGREFPVFDTSLGRMGMCICYDKVFPEGIRTMAIEGAHIICMPTAWKSGAPLKEGEYPSLDPHEDYILYLYDMFDRVRAAENQLWFISSNWVGVYDMIGGKMFFPGLSRIVDPNGIIIADIGYKEGITIVKADVKRGIIEARTKNLEGLNLLKDRKPVAYKGIDSEDDFYPPTHFKLLKY